MATPSEDQVTHQENDETEKRNPVYDMVIVVVAYFDKSRLSFCIGTVSIQNWLIEWCKSVDRSLDIVIKLVKNL